MTVGAKSGIILVIGVQLKGKTEVHMKLKSIISSALSAIIIAGAVPFVNIGTNAGQSDRSEPTEIMSGKVSYQEQIAGAAAATTTKKASTTTTTKKTATTTTTTKKATTTTTTTTSTTTTTTTTTRKAEQGKPIFKLSSTEICESEASERRERVTVSVEGADKLYCETLIYLYFDSRLTIEGAVKGEAIGQLTTGQALGDTKDFLVLTTGGDTDAGRDGLMWSIDVTLPADCKAGDVFGFEVGQSKYGRIEPLFTNFAHDEKGEAMTRYIFSRGLDKGSIRIIEDPPYSLGDVNNDKLVDSVDASLVLHEYAAVSSGMATTFTDKRQILAADVNNDGKTDSVDASTILAYYAYISSHSDKVSLEEFINKKG